MNCDRVGERHTNNSGNTFRIIEYFSYDNITVEFLDGTIVKNREYKECKKGTIKNPMYPSVFSVGFMGLGEFTSRDSLGNKTFSYKSWINMLQRCYSEKFQIKNPTYKGCSVTEEWHNFQNFAQWYEERYKQGFELDKDLLSNDIKIYSPKTCCFLPKEINIILTISNKGDSPSGVRVLSNGKFQVRYCVHGVTKYLGVYENKCDAFKVSKIAKEAHIKELAEKWKDDIEYRAYIAMINYKITTLKI